MVVFLIILATAILWYEPTIPEAIKFRKEIYRLNASKIADIGYPVNYLQNELLTTEEVLYRIRFDIMIATILGLPLLPAFTESAKASGGSVPPAHAQISRLDRPNSQFTFENFSLREFLDGNIVYDNTSNRIIILNDQEIDQLQSLLNRIGSGKITINQAILKLRGGVLCGIA